MTSTLFVAYMEAIICPQRSEFKRMGHVHICSYRNPFSCGSQENGCGKVKISGLAVRDARGKLRRATNSATCCLGSSEFGRVWACISGEAPFTRTEGRHQIPQKPLRHRCPGHHIKMNFGYQLMNSYGSHMRTAGTAMPLCCNGSKV